MNDDDFPTTMSPAMHAGVRAIAQQRARRSPTSRNTREGRYVGRFHGKAVRRRALLPPLLIGEVELFPPSVPFPDSGIAWLTMNERSPTPPVLPLRVRYRTRTMRAEVTIESARA